MNKMIFHISDSIQQSRNIRYLLATSQNFIKTLGGDYKTDFSDRASLTITVPDSYMQAVKEHLYDKLGDIIAVSYKYSFMVRYIRTGGLTSLDYEMLIAAVIAADLDEDKRYIVSGKPDLSDFTIDGFFNFRLRPLKEKWAEVVSYIPTYFSTDKFNAFISYIACERKGRRAFIEQGKVYDSHFNRMQKGLLVADIKEGVIAREVILSGFSEVLLNCSLPETDRRYLINFLGDKIFFKKQKNGLQKG